MNILCVDPGILAVGLFGGTVNGYGCITRIYHVSIVDVTKPFRKERASLHKYMCTFFDMYTTLFCQADVIVLERQPIASAGFPLELMFRERFGDKCKFVAPSTLHKHYDLAAYTYEGRKAKCVSTVLNALQIWVAGKLPGAADAIRTIESMDRKHDCCDACLIFMYYVTTTQFPNPPPTSTISFQTEVIRVASHTDNSTMDTTDFKSFIEKFKYKKD